METRITTLLDDPMRPVRGEERWEAPRPGMGQVDVPPRRRKESPVTQEERRVKRAQRKAERQRRKAGRR